MTSYTRNLTDPATGSLVGSPIGFEGQYLDSAIGMYDLRARDYDPASGRFTANDPVAIPTGMPYVTGYSYSFNNPLVLTDASGMWATADRDRLGNAGMGSRSGGTQYNDPLAFTDPLAVSMMRGDWAA